MRKKVLLGTVVCSLLVLLFSCNHEIGVGLGTDNSVATGNILGTVQYSNADKNQNGGIMITLDKTDGLHTAAVTKSAVSRSIVDSSRTVVSSSYTSEDGSYSFSNLEPGTYTVYASSAYSKERAVYTNAVVRANETTTVASINLTATGSIIGRIQIDWQSYGNTGFLVFVAGTSFMAMTDDSGNYTISDVPAGKSYQVVASKNGVIHNLSSYVTVNANKSTKLSNAYFTSSELEAGLKGDKGDKGESGEKGSDGASMVWLGSFASDEEIYENGIYPEYLNAYFNTTDGCSYIYIGDAGWTLLARSGIQGEKGDDGEKGKDGKAMHWLGQYNSEDDISEPQYLDIYFNITDGCSYIWNGYDWEKISSKGDNGKVMHWLGNHGSADDISEPQYLDAYYNINDGCSYIWNGYNWEILSSRGLKGDKGDTGSDGLSISWLGSFESEEAIYENGIYPEYLNAYFNITDGCAYIWNGNDWDKLSSKGDKGDKGDAGDAGVSIIWRGSFASAAYIDNPVAMNAYYNTSDGCSYIYNGSEWQLLARKGTDGAISSNETGIRWLGEFADYSERPSNPKILDAFFDASTGCSFIYTGIEWQLLARGGSSINWLGSYSNPVNIPNPKYLDAYFNTTENCTYMYDAKKWTVLAKGPGSGGTSSSSTVVASERDAIIEGTVLVGWTNPKGVIYIPTGVTDISQEVFKNRDEITRVIIPSTVEGIGKAAFYDCDGLKSVEIRGSGLKVIGAEAFYSCDTLVSINLPNKLESIGESAFNQCKNLIAVNIPDSVLSIGKNAYCDCTSLRTLTLGAGLTKLNFRTFKGCTAIVKVTIPNTVVSINNTVFAGCSSLSTLEISGSWNLSGVCSGTTDQLTVDDLQYNDSNEGASTWWTRD